MVDGRREVSALVDNRREVPASVDGRRKLPGSVDREITSVVWGVFHLSIKFETFLANAATFFIKNIFLN